MTVVSFFMEPPKSRRSQAVPMVPTDKKSIERKNGENILYLFFCFFFLVACWELSLGAAWYHRSEVMTHHAATRVPGIYVPCCQVEYFRTKCNTGVRIDRFYYRFKPNHWNIINIVWSKKKPDGWEMIIADNFGETYDVN